MRCTAVQRRQEVVDWEDALPEAAAREPRRAARRERVGVAHLRVRIGVKVKVRARVRVRVGVRVRAMPESVRGRGTHLAVARVPQPRARVHGLLRPAAVHGRVQVNEVPFDCGRGCLVRVVD